MNDLDQKIQEALDTEDRDLFDQFGEQGLFGQFFGVYDGKMGGLAILATVITFALLIGAVYCAVKFFSVSSAVEAARWGAGAVMLMVMVGFLKIWFWMRMEANRVLREVKRVELQIARMQNR